jgi:FHA domain/Protein of unknown function (DUF3662)
MATLDDFESRLQALLEIHLLKHLPGYKVEDGIAQHLAAAMHGNLKEDAGGMQAPNLFGIVAHPTTLTRWHAKPRLLKELADTVYRAGKAEGFRFSIKPVVSTIPDINMPVNDLHVVVSFSEDGLAETQGISQRTLSVPAAEKVSGNAFLMIGGTQIVPLNRPVINIGRRLDNHVVLDDPRVSRAHAQLRFVKDRFVLFDLNSSGGTFVNGQRVNRSALSAGDVISLAGVKLIFGQDLPAGQAPNEGQTEPGAPVSIEPPTASSREDNDFTK